MTKCKKWINGKCFGLKETKCPKKCGFYDENFNIKKAVADMLEYAAEHNGMKQDVGKMFDLIVEDLGDEAENLIGTTDFDKWWSKIRPGEKQRRAYTFFDEDDMDKIMELRSAGFSLRKIGEMTGYSYSVIQKKLQSEGWR